MPNGNKTFSSKDVVRIFQNHLTEKEQEQVLCFFCHYCEVASKKKILESELLDLLTAFIGFIPIGGDLVNLLKQSLDTIDALLQIVESVKTPKECLSDTYHAPGLIQDVLDLYAQTKQQKKLLTKRRR